MRPETLCRNNHRDEDPRPESPCPVCVVEAAAYPPAPALQTQFVAGLEFERPTWDRAPTPWNPSGSWTDEPETTERLLAGIRAAVPDHESLALQAISATGDGSCRTFWGSHGCDLTTGHEGLHVCGHAGDLCSAMMPWGEDGGAILWWARDDGLELSSHRWTWFT